RIPGQDGAPRGAAPRPDNANDTAGPDGTFALDGSLSDTLDDYERDLIARALAAARGNVAEAARRLRTDRANLYRRMRRLDIEAEATCRDAPWRSPSSCSAPWSSPRRARSRWPSVPIPPPPIRDEGRSRRMWRARRWPSTTRQRRCAASAPTWSTA